MATPAHSFISDPALGEMYGATSRVRIGGVDTRVKLSFECLPWDASRAEDIAAAATADEALNAACAVAKVIASEKGARSEDAVYVIGTNDRSVCKIGVASDPLKRMADLQTGCPDSLRIFALFWSMDRCAKALEMVCLRVASDMGVRLRGEWVRLNPGDAARLIATVVAGIGSPFADSAMWLRNRQRLLDAKRAMFSDRADATVTYHGQTIARYGVGLAMSVKHKRILKS